MGGSGEPATVDYLALCRAAKTIAAGCLISRYLPEATNSERLLLALENCNSRLASRLRDWLGLCRSSDADAADNDDFLKGPKPSYLLDNGLPDPMEAVLARLENDRPTFWSEPVADGCAQIRELRGNAANQGRDSWWLDLGVLAYCEDGDQFAHLWGSQHPKYSPEETQRELDGWRRKADGATLCVTLTGKVRVFAKGVPSGERSIRRSASASGRTRPPR